MFERIRPYLRWFFNNPYCEYGFYIIAFILSLFFFRRLFMGMGN